MISATIQFRLPSLSSVAHSPRDLQSPRVSEIQQHDHEEKHDHDRARVNEHLHHADELRIEQNVDSRKREHRIHEPERGCHRDSCA
jgi:hypothetical protein